MKRIWAPWRMEYIEDVNNSGCIFCQAIGERKDEKNLLLFRGDNSFIIMNRYPYTTGHLMVAPNEHIPAFDKLADDSVVEVIRLVDQATAALSDTMNPDGFNVGINLGRVAGAGIEGHLHIHIVPRWQGDTNFMPVLNDTKIVNETLKNTYERLKNKFQ